MGYNIYNCDRRTLNDQLSRGGDIMIAAHQCIFSKLVFLLDESPRWKELDAIFVNVQRSFTKLLIAVACIPSFTRRCYKEFANILEVSQVIT